MVRLVPERPEFATTSEREVWERLRTTLGEDDVLFANVRLTDEEKDHEADLVVAMPGFGVVVVEVKGAGLRHDEQGWWMEHVSGDRYVDPVGQARMSKYALKRFVEHHPRW